MKLKTGEEADVNITALIDCLMQCIIFFMVIMTAEYTYGVAIKFPAGRGSADDNKPKEKTITVYIQSDYLDRAPDGSHYVKQDGVLKLNGKEIALVTSVGDRTKWEEERARGFGYLRGEMKRLIDEEGYKKDVLTIQGDMKTYHWKVMQVIDAGKADSIAGFSLVPPQT